MPKFTCVDFFVPLLWGKMTAKNYGAPSSSFRFNRMRLGFFQFSQQNHHYILLAVTELCSHLYSHHLPVEYNDLSDQALVMCPVLELEWHHLALKHVDWGEGRM